MELRLSEWDFVVGHLHSRQKNGADHERIPEILAQIDDALENFENTPEGEDPDYILMIPFESGIDRLIIADAMSAYEVGW